MLLWPRDHSLRTADTALGAGSVAQMSGPAAEYLCQRTFEASYRAEQGVAGRGRPQDSPELCSQPSESVVLPADSSSRRAPPPPSEEALYGPPTGALLVATSGVFQLRVPVKTRPSRAFVSRTPSAGVAAGSAPEDLSSQGARRPEDKPRLL